MRAAAGRPEAGFRAQSPAPRPAQVQVPYGLRLEPTTTHQRSLLVLASNEAGRRWLGTSAREGEI